MDTNETWSRFKTPFSKAPTITQLYGVYSNGGDTLGEEIKDILGSESPPDIKKQAVWDQLYKNVLKMREEFSDKLQRYHNGEQVLPYEAGTISTVQAIEG